MLGQLAVVEVIDRGREGERRHPPHGLAAHPQRLAAGGDDAQLGAAPEQLLDQRRAGVHDVLTGVEDQQHPPWPQRLGQRLGQRPVRLLPDPERGRDPPRDQGRVLGVGQLDQPGAVGEAGDDLAGEPEREPGLADAAGSAQGQDADIAKQPGKLGQIPLPADEAVRLGREISVTQHGLSSHSPSVMVAVTRQFVTPAPPARSHGPEPGISRQRPPPAPNWRAPSPEIIAFVMVPAAGFRRSPRSPRDRCSGPARST